jgi:hypothetical protein
MQFEPVRDPPTGVHGQPVSPQQYALRSASWHWRVSYRIECTPKCGPLGALSACCSDVGDRNPQDFGAKAFHALKIGMESTPIVPSHAVWRALGCELIQGGGP